nr:hypothetical protein [Micromonospora sp. DSM 115978]
SAGRQLGALAAPDEQDSPAQAAVAASYRDLATVVAELGPPVNGAPGGGTSGDGASATGIPASGTGGDGEPTPSPAEQEGAAGEGPTASADGADGASAGGQSGLAGQLDVVARCIEAGAPTRAYAVSMGGFDTHAGELGTHSALLSELDAAVAGFQARMATAASSSLSSA